MLPHTHTHTLTHTGQHMLDFLLFSDTHIPIQIHIYILVHPLTYMHPLHKQQHYDFYKILKYFTS